MKTITVRLPEALAAEIEREAHRRQISQAAVVRERLWHAKLSKDHGTSAIIDLIGSVDGLPADLSSGKRQHHLRATGYGRKRAR